MATTQPHPSNYELSNAIATPPSTTRSSRTKNLSNDDRERVLSALLRKSSSGKLHRKALASVATTFDISTRTARRV